MVLPAMDDSRPDPPRLVLPPGTAPCATEPRTVPARRRGSRSRGLQGAVGPRPWLWQALEPQVLADRHRKHYRSVRPHSVLSFQPLAPQALVPWPPSCELPAAHTEPTL